MQNLKEKLLENIDRNTKFGFRYYMEKNPHYFKYVFGDISIEKAWKQVRELKKLYSIEELICEPAEFTTRIRRGNHNGGE